MITGLTFYYRLNFGMSQAVLNYCTCYLGVSLSYDVIVDQDSWWVFSTDDFTVPYDHPTWVCLASGPFREDVCGTWA